MKGEISVGVEIEQSNRYRTFEQKSNPSIMKKCWKKIVEYRNKKKIKIS